MLMNDDVLLFLRYFAQIFWKTDTVSFDTYEPNDPIHNYRRECNSLDEVSKWMSEWRDEGSRIYAYTVTEDGEEAHVQVIERMKEGGWSFII
jgi:hypothetical protein